MRRERERDRERYVLVTEKREGSERETKLHGERRERESRARKESSE